MPTWCGHPVVSMLTMTDASLIMLQTYFTSLLSKFVAQLPAMMGNFTETFTESAMKNVTGTYSISGTYCTPQSGDPGNGNIQLLVHGYVCCQKGELLSLTCIQTRSIGFDSSYWDFAATGQDYSYVSAAAKAGHSTFRYDRLGTGLSEHPAETYNVVQAATDIAILTEIITMLKNGKIGGKKFTKIAGVGHSYGSVQLQSVTRNVPSALDTVVLTGFSANTSYVRCCKQCASVQADSFDRYRSTSPRLLTRPPLWFSQNDSLARSRMAI